VNKAKLHAIPSFYSFSIVVNHVSKAKRKKNLGGRPGENKVLKKKTEIGAEKGQRKKVKPGMTHG
jgi:hypothetical protein